MAFGAPFAAFGEKPFGFGKTGKCGPVLGPVGKVCKSFTPSSKLVPVPLTQWVPTTTTVPFMISKAIPTKSFTPLPTSGPRTVFGKPIPLGAFPAPMQKAWGKPVPWAGKGMGMGPGMEMGPGMGMGLGMGMGPGMEMGPGMWMGPGMGMGPMGMGPMMMGSEF